MPTPISIERYTIDTNQPCFIIAEAGVNHNGDEAIARELVEQAAKTGAHCVKFQTFSAERVVTRDAPKADYQLKTTNPQESQIEMLKKLVLPVDAYERLVQQTRDLGMVFMSTPYSEEDVDFLDELGVSAFKLASIHLAEPYFLQYVARKGKPMIVSTGMATLAEVDVAVRAIRETGNEQVILLQCTTNYPSRAEDANLRTITTMRHAFDVHVGYSDHTQTDTACIASIALGACVIEKHFTLDTSMPGPDQTTSYDPPAFTRLVQAIQETETLMGSAIKQPTAVELVNAKGMRRSIVTKRAIKAGETLTADMLTFKRPASGLKPVFLSQLVGKTVVTDLPQDTFIAWEHIGNE
ncbi:MAG: N-acetylneuraminate synthase [Chloroflexota bacterium]